MTNSIDVVVEWLEAPGVNTPELAATWAGYRVRVGDEYVTQVEAADGSLRKSVYGSLYPLAEWIATNWWALTTHIRPSAIQSRYWTWRQLRSQPWLRVHNFRGAGDGMSWPDLTIVPQGGATLVRWVADSSRTYGHVRFVTSGTAWVPTDSVVSSLAALVERVLDRLTDKGIPKSRLAEDWAAIASADADEQAFCRAVARLGQDPYSVSDDVRDAVIAANSSLPDELVDDFFDSVDPSSVIGASEWTQRARPAAREAAAKAQNSLASLYDAARDRRPTPSVAVKPWHVGYALARAVRESLGVNDDQPFSLTPWVGTQGLPAPSHGIQGYVAVEDDRCGLVLGALGAPHRTGQSHQFRQARALGRVLARPDQRTFLLSGARGHDERLAGAFAAELLAPADGIRKVLDGVDEYLDGVDEYGDGALDAVARHFDVSPMVVHHQYENQIASTDF